MKKTKFMTRLGAVVFALAILFAMAVPAFADGETGDKYSGDSQTTIDPTNKTIQLNKGIAVFNPESISVRLPATTYSYTVEPYTFATGTSATVTDKNQNQATVNNGVEYGVSSTATISFAQTDTVTADSTGAEKEKSTTLTVDLSKFEHAGIYRYKVTESNNTLAADGILRDSGYSAVRYLDVYIGNVENSNALELVGAVFFTTAQTGANQTAGSDSITPTFVGKTTGFEPGVVPGQAGADVDYTDDATVDKYYTYNLTVTKTTTGNMADKKNKFPITVNMTKANGVDDVTVDFSVSNDAATRTSDATATLGSSVAFVAGLADGGSMYIKGIPYYTGSTPAYATVNSISDQNNTSDKYTPSITSATGLTSTLAFANEATNAGATATTSGAANFNATPYAATINVKNTMSEISPTGLVFRVAPYALMLTAGISLILLFAKRRREVTDMI